VGDGYPLLLDFGCFHTLPSPPATHLRNRRLARSRAGCDASVFGFHGRGVAPLHAGITGAGWELVDAERTSVEEVVERRVRRAVDRFEL
jgi:hypothetical protein